MARLAGINIPDEKRLVISLTYIHGVGRTTAKNIIKLAGLNESTRVKDLAEGELAVLQNAISEMQVPVEGELRRIIRQNIRRLMDIKSYRGQRHRDGLPVRGQSTRRNARTRKGKKKTVGGMKRKLTKK